jgi:diaminopimelate decarboxylase
MCGFVAERAHILPETAWRDESGQLWTGGVPLPRLAEQYGTPLYLYDVATIRAAIAAYRHGLESYPGETALVYAAKAFAAVGLLRLLASEGLGVDCVSEGELALARAAGVPAERLVFHGNNKSEEELRFALELGVGRIVVDNHDELERLAAIARSTGKTVSILLRLNPGVEPHDTHAYRRTGQLDSKFGLPIVTGDAEAAVARCLSTPELALLGFHVHIGSQLFDLIPYQRAIEQVFAFAGELSRRFAFSLREFSPGGGFGIPYTAEDPVLDLAEATAQVSRWVAEAASMAGLPLPASCSSRAARWSDVLAWRSTGWGVSSVFPGSAPTWQWTVGWRTISGRRCMGRAISHFRSSSERIDAASVSPWWASIASQAMYW